MVTVGSLRKKRQLKSCRTYHKREGSVSLGEGSADELRSEIAAASAVQQISNDASHTCVNIKPNILGLLDNPRTVEAWEIQVETESCPSLYPSARSLQGKLLKSLSCCGYKIGICLSQVR